MNHLLPETNSIYTCTWSNFLCRKPPLDDSHTPREWEKSTSEWVNADETHFYHNPHPKPGDSQLEWNSQTPNSPCWAKSLVLHLAPQLFRPALRDESPKHLALNAQTACVHQTHKAIANWETFLKGLVQHRCSWEASRLFCERGLFDCLKASAWGARI